MSTGNSRQLTTGLLVSIIVAMLFVTILATYKSTEKQEANRAVQKELKAIKI
jgi:hypothetical protein